MPAELDKTNEQLSEADQWLRNAHWKQQSLAAVTLVQLGFEDEVWPLLEFTPDPSLRSFIIHYLGKLGTNSNTLAARLQLENDVRIRRALIQSLGGLDASLIPPADRSRIAEGLQTSYVNDSDSGIHSSASWTLRRWGVTLPELPVGEQPLVDGNRRWYVNGQGQTMVVITDPPGFRNITVNHSFAIATHEVTVAEFHRFRVLSYKIDRSVAPTDDCPMHHVDIFQAAEYCNWLSKQEGIAEDEWIYEPNANGRYEYGMRIKGKYLELSGYRLPDEQEWEAACRGGATGSYGFGEPLSLLENYGWYALSAGGQSHPVESLLPNEIGLFDMHGNIWEMTQSPVSSDQTRYPDPAVLTPWEKGGIHVWRSGSFVPHDSWVRTTLRFVWNVDAIGDAKNDVGFRVVRSIPPL